MPIVYLVIDGSGSMRYDNREGNAKSAAWQLANKLNNSLPDEVKPLIGVDVFEGGNSSKRHLRPTNDMNQIRNAIYGWGNGGYTGIRICC